MNKQSRYLAEQEAALQCDLEPTGTTFCLSEDDSENLTKHEDTCFVHSQTDTWLIHNELVIPFSLTASEK